MLVKDVAFFTPGSKISYGWQNSIQTFVIGGTKRKGYNLIGPGTRPPRKTDLMLTGNRYSLHNAKSIIRLEKVKVSGDWLFRMYGISFLVGNYRNWAITIQSCSHGNVVAGGIILLLFPSGYVDSVFY